MKTQNYAGRFMIYDLRPASLAGGFMNYFFSLFLNHKSYILNLISYVLALTFAFCAFTLSGVEGLNLNKVEAAEFSLGVYPPLLKIHAQPPAIINAPITIQNLSENQLDLDVVIKSLTAKNEDEEKMFFSKIQVLDKTSPLKTLNLGPKQKKDLFVKMVIHKDIPQKDYYFSIQFISKTNNVDKDTNYSQIQGGVALNILASFGKQDVKAVIEEFSAPLFVPKNSVPFVIRVKNKGNHFIAPYGTITIRNIFNQTVQRINLPSVNILTKSTKSVHASWERSFILGLYTATLDISVSEEGPNFIRSLSFFALPVRSVLIAIILTLIILFIYIRARKRAGI